MYIIRQMGGGWVVPGGGSLLSAEQSSIAKALRVSGAAEPLFYLVCLFFHLFIIRKLKPTPAGLRSTLTHPVTFSALGTGLAVS